MAHPLMSDQAFADGRKWSLSQLAAYLQQQGVAAEDWVEAPVPLA